jgi:hypothetical protein
MEIDAPDPPPPGRVRIVQRPVYYINEVLHEAKMRYLEVHKLLYAVLIASKKLRHFFQAHKILVVSSYPLRAILHNPNATGNIAKWAAELAEFELDFVSRHAIKSQVLADFIVDWTPPASHLGGRCGSFTPRSTWGPFQVHGAPRLPSNQQHGGVQSPAFLVEYSLVLGAQQLLIKGDSQLIIKRVKGDCCCSDPQLAAYLLHV